MKCYLTKVRSIDCHAHTIRIGNDHTNMFPTNCTELQCPGRSVKIFGIVLCLSFVILVTKLSTQTGGPLHEFLAMSIAAKPRILSRLAKDNETVYQRYIKIKHKYKIKLGSLSHNIYKPFGDFIDYGPPVKTLLSENAPKVKRILLWTKFFQNTSFVPKKLSCAGGLTCDVTYDKSDLLSSDAIVIHMNNIRGAQDLPPQRQPFQRWVHFLMESPYNSHVPFHDFNNVYNFTATYRLDSDVITSYFTDHPRKQNLSETEFDGVISNIVKLKSRLVAGLISNCDERRTTRLTFIRRLKKTIPVDLFGKCGTLACKRDSKECDDVMNTYKFYLSLENGNCRDYITEKVGKALFKWKSVPVVMGGADPGDYERFLPPGSYIHSSGFESPDDLAEYLILLDTDPVLYQQYHTWRRWYTGSLYESELCWCQLCIKLYNDSMPVQTYRDLDGWHKQDVCKK